MRRCLLATMLIVWPVVANAVEPKCGSSFGPIVPDAATARAIAKAIIAARQTTKVSKKYRILIDLDGEGAGGWVVSQTLLQSRNRDPKMIAITRGGGGMRMRIDRCTGAISDIYYMR